MPINLTAAPQAEKAQERLALPTPDVSVKPDEVNGRQAIVTTIVWYLPEADQVQGNTTTRMGKKTFNEDGTLKEDNSNKPSSQLVTYGKVEDTALSFDQNGTPVFLRDDEYNGGATLVLRSAIFSRQQFGSDAVDEPQAEPEA